MFSPHIPRPPRPNRTFSGVNVSSPHSSSRGVSAPMGPIEANSLSTITPIADDPPIQFIIPPTSTPGEREQRYPQPALVLYFVRIPGSRDLFLTPMHPLKSTVTAQDVEGCLYYVHVHGEGSGGGDGGNGEYMGQQTGQGGRPPLLSTGSSGSGIRRWSAHNILHHTRKGGDIKDFSMTVIRRDPATGTQWNVAHISSTGSGDGMQMLSQDGQAPPPPPMVISLPGEGYKKFMSPGSMRRKPIPGSGEPQYNLPPLPSPPQPPLGLQGRDVRPEEEEAYFRRKREYQELLASRDRQIQQIQLDQAERDRELQTAEEEKGLVREVVWDSAASGAGEKWWKRGMNKTTRHFRSTSTGRASADDKEEKKNKDHWKGYAFNALWGSLRNAGRGQKAGTCRFKDVGGGKIMKCKYYPADGSESWLVSALEFKLPGSGGFHSPSPIGSGGEGGERGDGGGEKAKLGTLVIHNTGVEMLDLAVSANVGLFWRKWEGWVGERGALGQ